jgi:hypothetical protein
MPVTESSRQYGWPRTCTAWIGLWSPGRNFRSGQAFMGSMRVSDSVRSRGRYAWGQPQDPFKSRNGLLQLRRTCLRADSTCRGCRSSRRPALHKVYNNGYEEFLVCGDRGGPVHELFDGVVRKVHFWVESEQPVQVWDDRVGKVDLIESTLQTR